MTGSSTKAFSMIDIIQRSGKPRTIGLTMVLDKGIGLYQVADLMQAGDYIDIVKLGWATPRLFPEAVIKQKISLYTKNNIVVCNGGTILEIAFRQGKVDQFLNYCQETGITAIEVSNGIMPIDISQKAELISKAHKLGFYVISEVGKKDPAEDKKLSLPDRINEAKSDLNAGAHYVIIEAREGGRGLGIYDESGALKESMARSLVDELCLERIMFEAPEKNQQARLILLFGSDVNLGNILPDDVIPLETLRCGIRGDTCVKFEDHIRL